jgi:serine/threonine protein kinase
MAELRVVGDYVGPGEQRTAETLAAELPPDWVLVANRSLPTREQDDMDLVAIGKNLIFLIEEKSWGPEVRMGTMWEVRGRGRPDRRPNPIPRVSKVARILAGLLRRVDSYPQQAQLVRNYVVMSHPHLQLKDEDAGEEADLVLLLDEAAGTLIRDDRAARTGLGNARQAVIDFISGWGGRPERPATVGSYNVIGETAGLGRAKVYVGRDDVGHMVFLRCYPMDGWGPGSDPMDVVRRERTAIEKVAAAGRTLRSDPVFTDDEHRWYVVPIVVDQEILSLKGLLAQAGAPIHPASSDPLAITEFVRDAFEGLAQLHSEGVLHRGIHPSRVARGADGRIKFLDLYLAHVSGERTIAEDLSDRADVGYEFRAPECKEFIGSARPASDIYSLAASLLWWIQGGRPATGSDIDSVRDDLLPVAGLLRSCLALDPADRPDEVTLIDALGTLERSQTSVRQTPESVVAAPAVDAVTSIPAAFTAGALIRSRYELDRQLGEGGYAQSWLARDTRTDQQRVLKLYKSSVSEELAKREYQSAAEIVHDRCSRVFDIELSPSLMLIVEYVPGESLEDAAKSRIDVEDFRTYALDVLAGLSYIHERGLVHRDVTPRNIIVETETRRAKLIDFGLARAQDGAVTLVGTPRFMAPEISSGAAATTRSDLYSLGVTFLRCMLGRWPYRVDEFDVPDKLSIVAMSNAEEARLGALGVSIAHQFFRLISPDIGDRPDTAAEVIDDLRRAVPVTATPGAELVNPTVAQLRRLYRGSKIGNAGNRGLDDEFAKVTYVPTLLDTSLTPTIIRGDLDLVLLTGNPGDGKTSFLVKLRDELHLAGAVLENEGPGGWLLSTRARTFAAVYDASESRDGKTSDELIFQAMQPVSDSLPHTALIAINDGRLRRFFEDYEDIYPEYAEAVKGASTQSDSRVAVVDLKRRSLAPTSDDPEGLAGHVLNSLTQPEFWTVCTGCKARQVCPILRNRNQLSADSHRPFLELVTISHLRRERRATLRDLRSAAAWVLTGDRGCTDVHEAGDAGIDLRLGNDALAFDLAFDSASTDYLVQEWSAVDPTRLPVADLERAARSREASNPIDRAASLNRRAFFSDGPFIVNERRNVMAYRFLDDFRGALDSNESSTLLLPRVLLGLSRILGAFGYDGPNLALQDGEHDGWAVLREVSASEFQLTREVATSRYVEQQADSLTLVHPMARLSITLDAAELILRAADGELIKDAASNAVKLELEMLAARLSLHPAEAAVVVNPAGDAVHVEEVSGTIVMVEPR